jgi:acyl-coenzyme A synthetase/AMP-(fatty) acid ligase
MIRRIEIDYIAFLCRPDDFLEVTGDNLDAAEGLRCGVEHPLVQDAGVFIAPERDLEHAAAVYTP